MSVSAAAISRGSLAHEAIEQRPHVAVGEVAEADFILHGIGAGHRPIVEVEHVGFADLGPADAGFDHRLDLAHRCCAKLDEGRVVDRDAGAGEPVEHLVGKGLEPAQPLMRFLQLAAIGPRVGREGVEAGLHAVDALLHEARRLRDAVGLAVDHGDEVADVADGGADAREGALRDAAGLHARLDLGGDASASRVSEATVAPISLVASAVSWASFFTSAATTAKERPASPARAASMVALSASMLVFLAIVSIGGGTLRTLAIASAKPAMRSPSWTTRLVSPWKTRIVSSIASRPAPICRAPARRACAPHRSNRPPAPDRQQAAGDLLERVERLEVGRDAPGYPGNVAGHVAALDRQAPAIARHLVDRRAVSPFGQRTRQGLPLLIPDAAPD
jgi:hypothetical protein